MMYQICRKNSTSGISCVVFTPESQQDPAHFSQLGRAVLQLLEYRTAKSMHNAGIL